MQKLDIKSPNNTGSSKLVSLGYGANHLNTTKVVGCAAQPQRRNQYDFFNTF
jgi:hypothetical protein